MKLIYRIVIRISLLLILVLGVWAVFFYMATMDEVNDEVDDSLEDYSDEKEPETLCLQAPKAHQRAIGYLL